MAILYGWARRPRSEAVPSVILFVKVFLDEFDHSVSGSRDRFLPDSVVETFSSSRVLSIFSLPPPIPCVLRRAILAQSDCWLGALRSRFLRLLGRRGLRLMREAP